MKPYIVIQGPVATRSGYGNHTRDLVTSLIKSDKYDIHIVSLPWGVTPMTALEKDNPDHQAIVRNFDQTIRTSHNILPVRLLRCHGIFFLNRLGDCAGCEGGMERTK